MAQAIALIDMSRTTEIVGKIAIVEDKTSKKGTPYQRLSLVDATVGGKPNGQWTNVANFNDDLKPKAAAAKGKVVKMTGVFVTTQENYPPSFALGRFADIALEA